MGYTPWCRKESETIERLTHAQYTEHLIYYISSVKKKKKKKQKRKENSVHFRMSDSHNANTCSADYTFYPLFRGSWDSPCLLSADKIEVGEFNVVTDTLFSA